MHKITNEITLDEESPLYRGQLVDGNFYMPVESELDQYILSCGKALAAVDSSIAKSRISLSLISTVYLEVVCEEDKSKSAYIEILIENSIIRVQSIYDRALIFTNRVLNLGISSGCIHHELMVTNEHVKKYSLDSKLRKVHASCKDYKKIRNTVIHHDRYSEEQLDELQFIIDAEYLSKGAGKGSIMKSEDLHMLTESYLNAKQEELGEYLDNIEKTLFDLYDVIIPLYSHQKSKLRSA